MGGSSKSGSSQQSLNYYGTIAGALCWGPIDWLTAVVCNGNYIWQCSGSPLDLASAVNADGYVDLTGSILDPTLIASGGYFRLYIGTPTQTADAALAGHPPYLDTAYFVATNIFFGENSGTAPNFQFIVGRVPRVPTALVAAADNIASDRQINPVAALAEILMDDRGMGLPLASFEATSWLAAAHWCAQDAAHQAYAFCSPLITDQKPLRDLVREILDPLNGFLAWTPNGTLGCYIYEWGTDPGGLPIVDARYLTKKPKFVDGDWQDIPTEAMVAFTDRAYEFQSNSVLVPNARAAQIRQVDDQVQLDRKHITRQPQAQQHGSEYLHRICLAPGTGTVVARGPIVAGLFPGSKILIDTDPEPGGSGLAQLARIEKVDTDRTDEVTLELTLDPLLTATAYTPDWISPLPETTFAANVKTCAPLAHLLTIPLPPTAWGWPPSIGFLATRPDATVTGFKVLFGTDPSAAFAELGSQRGFAARMTVVNSIASGDGTIRLQLADGANGPDAYIAGNTPGGNAAAAADDMLLAILVQLDGSGRVALDGGGNPIMEFASIVERSAVTSDTHDYTVYRGRLGTAAAAWAAAGVAWIIPLASLTGWQHKLFSTLIGDVLYFRGVAFTAAAYDDSTPVPEADLVMPSAYAALATAYGDTTATGLNNATVFIYQRAASAPALPTADATYDFTTAALTGLNNGWNTTIPAADGNPLYASAATAISGGTTYAITPGEWAGAIILVQDGASGANGANGANTASVYLYQRAASAPSVPSSTTTYTFATAVLSGSLGGWSQSVPATNGQPLYVIVATAFAVGATDTIGTGEWSAPAIMAQDGAPGPTGLNNATLLIYQRASSAPALPSVNATYTFATAALTGLNNGWSTSVPAANGQPLFASAATAISAGATDTITPAEWAAAIILVQDGTNGSNGSNGSNGTNGTDGANTASVYLYQRAASAPSVPSSTTTYTFATAVLSGSLGSWSQSIPATNGQPLYVIAATAFAAASTDTIASGEWSTPVIMAQDGAPGAPGSTFTLTLPWTDNPIYAPTANGTAGGGTFAAGSVVTISAPSSYDDGSTHTFEEWAGGWPDIDQVESTTSPTTSIVMNGNYTIYADFT